MISGRSLLPVRGESLDPRLQPRTLWGVDMVVVVDLADTLDHMVELVDMGVRGGSGYQW